MVQTVTGGGEDYELCVAFKPAHFLLVARNGRSINQGNSGTRRPQDHYDVRTL